MRKALFLLLAGCSRYQVAPAREPVLHPFAEIPETTSRVCVLRPTRYASAQKTTAWDGKRLVGAAQGKSYFCYEAEPGHHTLTVFYDNPTKIELEAQAGESQYFVVRVPWLYGAPEIHRVSTERAMKMIDSLEQVVVTEAPAEFSLPGARPYAKAN